MVALPIIWRLPSYTVCNQWGAQQAWNLSLISRRIRMYKSFCFRKRFCDFFFHYIFWQYDYSPSVCFEKNEKELPSRCLGMERGKECAWQSHNPFICFAHYLYNHCVTWVPTLGQMIPSWISGNGCPILISFHKPLILSASSILFKMVWKFHMLIYSNAFFAY